MKIRTSDGVEIDGFEKIKTIRDEILGRPGASALRKGGFHGHQVKPPSEISSTKRIMGDIMDAVDRIKSGIWKGSAYFGIGYVSDDVKRDTKTILDKLCALSSRKGEVDVSCSAVEIKGVFRILDSAIQHMGKYSKTYESAMYDLMDPLN